MKEIQDIVNAYNKIDVSNVKLAMATVVGVDGSSYRRAGARMMIQENGQWTGGISGGCLEGDALKKAKYAMLQDRCEMVRYDTTQGDDHQIGVGLGCEGVIDILLSPLHTDRKHNAISVLQSCLDERYVNLLITVIKNETDFDVQEGDMLKYDRTDAFFDIFQDKATVIKKDVLNALQKMKSTVKEYDGLQLFFEVFTPAVHVVLFGYGYDVFPVAQIAKSLGWKVTIVTNPKKLAMRSYNMADEVLINGKIPDVDDFTAFVLMAHDEKTDRNNLELALQTDVPIIEMIGPVKRRNKIIAQLAEKGVVLKGTDYDRLYNPAGLDIGAITPEEIALSIIAEIKSVIAGRNGGHLKTKKSPIHDR